MPLSTPQAVRKQIAQRKPDPVYLIVGDDEAEMARLMRELSSLVEDELRAFNLEHMYAGEKSVTPASVVESARTLPMMGDRRVVVVLRAEKWLKAKRRARADEPEEEDDLEDSPQKLDVLTDYILQADSVTTLILMASDIARNSRLFKAVQKVGSVVECWGLKASARDPKDIKSWELEKIEREARGRATARIEREGHTIDSAAAKLLAQRAGTDIATLRGDVDRLLLYVGDKSRIELKDVEEVVSGEVSRDDWAVTNAIRDGNAPEALRQLALALECGAVPYMVLGQLAWFVRERLVEADPQRVPAAVEALFRTDLDLKTSGGDPRVLLERLVVELSR